MRLAAALVALALVLAAGAVAVSSCLVSRRSEGFACSKNSDCEDDRRCVDGFCVQSGCPSACSSCDLEDGTCRIDCTANRPCGAVACPAGFECTIRCNDAAACGDIDCAGGRGCDIECEGAAACGGIDCGDQACRIECSGALSCPAIGCADSCRCDVRCSNPSAACPSMSCPQFPGTVCTRNGAAGAPCDSTFDNVCDTCP